VDLALLQNSAAARLLYNLVTPPTSFCLAFVYLAYPLARAPPSPKALPAAGSFGRKMTMDDLIMHQIRCTCQEATLCFTASFDHAAANAFQLRRRVTCLRHQAGQVPLG
jgi:nuclear protein localization protein 4 homolog